MVDQNLLGYIKQKTGLGISKESIKTNLIQAGWSESEIEEGFGAMQPIAPSPSPLPLPSPLPSPSPVVVASQPQEVVQNRKILSKHGYFPQFSPKTIMLVLMVVLAVVLIGGGVYFYMNKSGLFAVSPYTEKNLLSGLLDAASRIDSSSYSASASLAMTKRDADARPFTSNLSNQEEVKKQYENDYQRARDASNLLGNLSNYRAPYPPSLQASKPLYSTKIIDPSTQQPYGYTLTEGGKNFALAVTFETYSAISQIRQSYNFSNVTTIISGKTVIFTKDSYPYFYISSTPPKPSLVALADMMAYVPPEAKVDFSASAQSDFSNEDSTDWKFNADATGDFGDLTYRMNIDALRKESMYYVRVNNMPTFLFSYIGFEKGQWIKIDPSKATSTGYYSYLSSLPTAEKYYKEHRQEVTDLLKKMIEIADSESLFTFKSPPNKETINGHVLYRYDLLVNKGAILPFYQRYLEEASKAGLVKHIDPGYADYLQTPEFSELFDYYQQNTSFTLWSDLQGFPVIASYSMRVVPADSVAQLKDKQANIVFTLKLSDINEPVNIEAPTDAKNFEDVFGAEISKEKDSTIKGNLSTILVNGAVYYDTNGNYASFCTNDYYLKPAAAITTAGGSPFCRANVARNAFCVCSSLNTAGDVYCIDSTGYKKQTTNTCANACTINGVCSNLSDGNTAQQQSQAPDFQGAGTVNSINKTGGSFTFIEGGVIRTVKLGVATKIFSAGLINIKFTDIRIGDSVRVHGSSNASTVTASIIYNDSIK